MTGGGRVAVVGAGAMGHGLAVHVAAHGRPVTLVDHRRSNLETAEGRMRAAAGFPADRGASTTRRRPSSTASTRPPTWRQGSGTPRWSWRPSPRTPRRSATSSAA